MVERDPPLRPTVVLTPDERKRVEDFVLLLIQIDRRARQTAPKGRGKRDQSRKSSKPKIEIPKAGSRSCGPCCFLITALSLSNKHKQCKAAHMVDTIVLALPKEMFHISDPDKFRPSARWAFLSSSQAIHGIQSKQTPTKKELITGIYKPRLTLSRLANLKGRPEIMLKIEVSLPKFAFGNNFDELMRKDFKLLMQKLAEILATMGVEVAATILAKAPVSAIHYSKNIPLTDGSTPYHFINKIKAANIKLSLDVNQTDYRNDGHSYKWHCNSYEIVFYDKIKDLEKAKLSSKRSVEKDSALQLNLFDAFEKRKKLEILRMEVRLNKRQKIKQLFKTLAIASDLTLNSVFKPSIAKKVLLHYLDELESKRPILLDYRASNDKALLAALIVNNPEMSAKQVLHTFGLKKALEIVNARELRGMFSKQNDRSWYRLIADVNKVKLPVLQSPFKVIRESVLKFKPLKLSKIA